MLCVEETVWFGEYLIKLLGLMLSLVVEEGFDKINSKFVELSINHFRDSIESN